MAELLAQRHGLPDPGTPRPADFDGLADFLSRYYAAMSGLRTEEDFYDLAAAYLDVARRQGVVYAEMFFDPQAHSARGVPFEDVVRGLHRAQVDARASGGPESALICCFLRDESAESALSTLDAVLTFKDWIVGVGLDSDERGNPPAKFASVFARARAAGFRLTMHCDPRQERSLDHLWQCLDVVGVDRIDHGVECLADDRLVSELVRRRLGLTVCPLSNLRLYGDLMGDAVTEMLRRELLVTVNSDDPAYFGGYVADNYRAVADEAHLDRAALVRLARNSFEAAWLAPERRSVYLQQLDDYVAAA
jgi:adenosine deaminase